MKHTKTYPLEGIRVIEMGSLIAGPFCGQMLGDFGAEVIKLETPKGGDPMRVWGRHKPGGKSLWFSVIARNKKSVTLDLRQLEGQELARELILQADIVVENFRPGTLEGWGLGWEELHRLNPKLIMVRVSGYGQNGPLSARAGFGSVGEALGGLRYLSGDPDRAPVRVGVSIGDALAGTLGALGAMMALFHRDRMDRERTGSTGQMVDISLFEAVLTYMECLIPEFAIAGEIRERSGSILPGIAPSNTYPTLDASWVVIGGNNDNVFRRLCAAMGQPELADDPKYSSHDARGAHMLELDDLIAQWTGTLEAETLVQILDKAGVPGSKIYTARDMLSDPHFAARASIVRLLHPELGEFPMQNVAPKLSETPGEVRSLGPELGQHNQEVYSDLLGRSLEVIAGLKTRGII